MSSNRRKYNAAKEKRTNSNKKRTPCLCKEKRSVFNVSSRSQKRNRQLQKELMKKY